jgi:cold shock CspA family protein
MNDVHLIDCRQRHVSRLSRRRSRESNPLVVAVTDFASVPQSRHEAQSSSRIYFYSEAVRLQRLGSFGTAILLQSGLMRDIVEPAGYRDWNVWQGVRCYDNPYWKHQSMKRPLQITFRGMDNSPALESLIRERVIRLEALYPRLTGCRVVVEVPHRGSESVKVPIAVSVEVDVPGTELILGKDEAGRHAAKEDHTIAVNNAFEAVERQLGKVGDTRSREVIPNSAQGQTGMVVRLYPDQNYGFIEVDNSPELYFTRNAVVGADYGELKVGMIVQVTLATTEGPMGPQASSVRLLDRNRTPS